MRIFGRGAFGQNTQWKWIPRRLICHVANCDAWSWLGLQFHRSLVVLAVLLFGQLVLAQSTTTQTFSNPYYTSVVCHTDGTFQNGEFDFLTYDAKGTPHYYKFLPYAPSNLNQYTPEMTVTEDGHVLMSFVDGTWEPTPPTYKFEAGTLPSAEISFTIQPVRGGFKAVNVTASLTR